MSIKKITSSGIVLVTKGPNNNKILLVKDSASSQWGFPKGEFKKGENLELTALRELKEETGLEANIYKYIGNVSYTFRYKGNTINKDAHYFIGIPTTNISKLHLNEENSDTKWVTVKEANSLITFSDLKSLLHVVSDLIINGFPPDSPRLTCERFTKDSCGFSEITEQHHITRYKFACKYIRKKDHVLDLGCGTGYGSKYLSIIADKVTAIDISEAEIQRATKLYQGNHLEFFNMTIDKVKDKFDVVVCFEVIEHLEIFKIPDFIFQIKRVLNNSGKLIISTPMDSKLGENIYHKSELDFPTLYTLLTNEFGQVSFFQQSWDSGEIRKGKPSATCDFGVFIAEKQPQVRRNFTKKDQKILDMAITQIKEILGNSLYGVILYGSRVYSTTVNKYSDYDIMLIVKQMPNIHIQMKKLRSRVLNNDVKFMYQILEEIPVDYHLSTTDYVLSEFNFEMLLGYTLYGKNPYKKIMALNRKDFAIDSYKNSQMRLYWARKGFQFYPKHQFSRRLEFYIKNIFYDLQNIAYLNGWLVKEKKTLLSKILDKTDILRVSEFNLLISFVENNLNLDVLEDKKDGNPLFETIVKVQTRISDYLRSSVTEYGFEFVK